MAATSFQLGGFTVNRMGFGAMQLAGPQVSGPPRDRAEARTTIISSTATTTR
ncbi:hypothetical protein [Sphingomonas sp.]|uniref:hypothetical protein n=1 Tax=Sphingomonas sp. TaxID=28214 RepID=UPI0037518210